MRGFVLGVVCVLALGLARPASAAIALDNSVDCNSTASPQTCSYTVGAGATILLCGANVPTGNTAASMTWNGGSMGSPVTSIDEGSTVDYVYALTSPSTGTHNLVFTATSAATVSLACVSYTGTATAAIPEAHATNSAVTVSTLSVSVTTLTANAWVVTYGTVHTAPGTPTGTGSIATTYSTAGTYHFLGDTGAIASPGSVTTGISTTASVTLGLITVSIQPGGGGGAVPCRRTTVGVGCEAAGG